MRESRLVCQTTTWTTTWRRLRRFRSAVVPIIACGVACGVNEPAPLAGPDSWAPGTAPHDVRVSGMTRDYLLHIPPRRPRSRLGVLLSYPLGIALHGSG